MTEAAGDEDDVPLKGEVLVGKVKLAGLLGWSPARLDRLLESEPEFPVRTRGAKGIAYEFELHEVGAFLRRREERRTIEEAATRSAKERSDPREARLVVKSKRLELTADRLARRLVTRGDAKTAIGALADELTAWRARLGAGLAKLDISQGARELCVRLIGDGADQLVRILEGAIGEREVNDR